MLDKPTYEELELKVQGLEKEVSKHNRTYSSGHDIGSVPPLTHQK